METATIPDTAPSPTPNRRRAARLVCMDGVKFRVHSWDKPATFIVGDISTDGLSLLDMTEQRVEVGTVLIGQLVLPHKPPMWFDLQVANIGLRRGRMHLGARFINLTLAHHRYLVAFLAYQGMLALQAKVRATPAT